MNFVGCVWGRGNHTARRGTIATDMMKMRLGRHEMSKRNCGRRLQGRYTLNSHVLKDKPLIINFYRYLHYYNRYMNHMQSLKFEHKLYASIKAKMEEMQQHNMSWIEVSMMVDEIRKKCLICLSNTRYRCNFSKRPWTFFASADRLLCVHTCSPTICARTTNR